jgi:Tfp pilus assembly protein PilF
MKVSIVISLGFIFGCGGFMQKTKSLVKGPHQDETERVSQTSTNRELNVGKGLYNKGDLKGALNAFEAAVDREADSPEAHYSLGLTYFDLGRYNDAINEYQMAIRLKPDLAEGHFNLGVAYDQSGQSEKALQSYQKAKNYGIDDAALHFNMGTSLLKLSRLNDAKKEYLRALELETNLAEAYNNLGYLDEAAGDLDLAITMYKKALAIKPDYQMARSNLDRLVKAPPTPRPPLISKKMISQLFIELDGKWAMSKDVEIETSGGKIENKVKYKRGILRVGYRPTQKVDLFLDLGLTAQDFEDFVLFPDVLGGINVDFKRVIGFCYGAGVDAEIYYWDRMNIGFDARLEFLFGWNEDEYKDVAWKARAEWSEYTLSLKARYLGLNLLVPYGGLTYSKLDGTIELDTGTVNSKQDYNESNALGILLGGSYYWGDHLRFQTEARFIDETSLAFRVRYSF